MKYIYIKKTVPGSYFDLDEKLTPDSYDNLGKTYEDYLNDCFVLLSDEQVKFHEDYPEASIQEVLNMKLKEKTLDEIKGEKLFEISNYDMSSNVNSFSINELSTWLDPTTRADYKQSIDAAKLLNEDTVSFFVEETKFDIPVDKADIMLAKIQLYANKCYMVTQQHKINVQNLESIDEINNYDFKSGYPEKLVFEI